MSIAEIDELRYCSQWAFIHAQLSRVPFALARFSCFVFDPRSTEQQTLSEVFTVNSQTRAMYAIFIFSIKFLHSLQCVRVHYSTP